MRTRALLPVMLIALAACAPPGSETLEASATGVTDTRPTAIDDTQLARHHWHLHAATDSNDQRVAALLDGSDPPIQLDFRDGRLVVGNICNRMGGGYFVAGERMQVDQLVRTRMFCADRTRMAREEAMGDFLESDPRLHVDSGSEPPRLQLISDDNRHLVFHGTPTAQARYGSAGETVFLEVAPEAPACAHDPCLRVRERVYDASGLRQTSDAQWRLLDGTIEGYTHEPGVRHVLRTKRFEVRDPQTNELSTVHLLDMIVETELVDR